MSILTPPKKYLWVWFAWLVLFYTTWLCIVVGWELWQTTQEHWPIALAMALGSYAAGATPMGGGTVGFPVLVLLFDMPASLGRDFSFAVQSIGMTSASIFILARRQPLASAVLKGAIIGSVVGTPLGIVFIAPLIPELWIKIVFAVIWAGFGLLHLIRIREISSHSGIIDFNEGWDFRLGLVLGLFASATVVSVTGVGIDMVVYAALVLLCRADLKIAIPTSVVIMAFNSVYGILIKIFTHDVQPGVFENWLAAAPIVALGAPLGVFMVSLLGRKPTLLFVAVLCVIQFVWTCSAEYEALQFKGVAIALAAVIALLLFFERLRVWGTILSGEHDNKSRHYSSLGYTDVEPHVHTEGNDPKL
ncbi:hypothetical protein TDB9533_01716 [Thalassocella blandensis]|nr:hypothetical protein TDB9533_01716 [Thalassocella blandensis]